MNDDAATLAARAERSLDPTEGLRAVADLRERLDELEARQVARGLARGFSWAQVGRSLRISKQAAHRRHAGRSRVGYELDTPPSPAAPEEPRVVITGEARDVVARARREAAQLGDHEVRPEHLLVALLQAPAGIAREALLTLGIDVGETRAELDRGQPGGAVVRTVTVSPATRSLLEASLGESQRLCHGHLGPEHLLLALLHDEAGPATELLLKLGATPADLDGAVCSVLQRADFARSL